MTFNSILNTLLSHANNDKALLDSFIGQVEAETLVSDNPDLYAAPTYDEQTGLWTLAQSVANTPNDEYEGVYRPASTTVCSLIDSLTVVAHQAPASPAAPARILPFGADPVTGWADLASVSALSQQEFSAFSIRSATPFEVTAGARGCEWEVCALNGNGTRGWQSISYQHWSFMPACTGSYDAGEDKFDSCNQGSSGGTYYSGVSADLNFQPTHIMYLDAEAYISNDTGTSACLTLVIFYQGQQLAQTYVTGSGIKTHEWNGDVLADRILIVARTRRSGGYGNTALRSICVRGYGFNPFA